MVMISCVIVLTILSISSFSQALPVQLPNAPICPTPPCTRHLSDVSYHVSIHDTTFTPKDGDVQKFLRRASKAPPFAVPRPPIVISPKPPAVSPSVTAPRLPAVPPPMVPVPPQPPAVVIPPVAAPPTSSSAPSSTGSSPVSPTTPSPAQLQQAGQLLAGITSHIFSTATGSQTKFSGKHTVTLLKQAFPTITGQCLSRTGLCSFDVSQDPSFKANRNPPTKTAWDDRSPAPGLTVAPWSTSEISSACQTAIALAIQNSALGRASAWSVAAPPRFGSNICLQINTKAGNTPTSCFPTGINPATVSVGTQCPTAARGTAPPAGDYTA